MKINTVGRIPGRSIFYFILIWTGLSMLEATAQEHFNPKGTAASGFTSALQAELRQSLPFEDVRDFEESRRGFIAEPQSRQIVAANGNIVWDMARYDCLLDGSNYDSNHPSLQRQASLNMIFGL